MDALAYAAWLDRHGSPELVAVHEAGHAVSAYLYGLPFTEVTVVPDPATGGLGCVRLANPASDPWHGLVVVVAGAAAVARQTGHRLDLRDTTDYQLAQRLAGQLAPPDGVETLLAQAVSAAFQLLGAPAHERAVEALAEELLQLGTVGALRAKAVIDVALGVASTPG
jgi:hypothetical protein